MNPADSSQNEARPSLTPSFPLSSREISRVMTNAGSPAPHLGWHSRGYLPHWDHPGMIQSLNFRLGDAMPQPVLEKWRQELGIASHVTGLCSLGAPAPLPASPNPSQRNPAGKGAGAPSATELRRRIEEYLDAGHGECWLRRPEIAGLVEDTLLIFDPERYRLLAWCVMPNHVHALIETKAGWPLDRILHSWKSFTSSKANHRLQRRGDFWQREYLDRYVRNAEHYENVLNYIEGNPVKAGLVKLKTDWPWSSARFRSGSHGSAGTLAGES
jgi:REP element-mobilizing transposase RayT